MILESRFRIETDPLSVHLDGGNQASWTPTTTLVTNLNADMLDGYHAASFLQTETDPLSIHLDGSSTTSAVIPFAEGISIDNWGGSTDKRLYLGTAGVDGRAYIEFDPDLFDNGYPSLVIRADDNDNAGGTAFQFWASGSNVAGQPGGFVDIRAGRGAGSGGVYGPGGQAYFAGGQGSQDYDGGDAVIRGGPHSQAGTGSAGDVILYPGHDYAGSNHGVVRVYDESTASYWTLVDPAGNAFTQNLTISGTTTIESHTGILKGTSGVVSTASGSDLLTAIGTIDISSATNLAVSSPITLTGDTVGFDFSTNNTWTGTNTFNNTINGGGDGTGVQANFYSDTAGNPIFRVNASTANAQFGPDPLHLTFNADRDSVAIVNNTSSTSQSRGLIVFAEYDGTLSRSGNLMGFNAFAHWESDANSTGTIMGGRNGVRIYGTSPTITAAFGSDVFLNILSSGSPTITEWVGINGSQDSIGPNYTVTTYNGIYLRGVSMTGGTVGTAIGIRVGASSYSSGTFTNNYGAYFDELSSATNNYEAWFAGGGGAFFRAAAQQIYSSAANTLDDDAGTTRNWRIGGTTKASLTSSLLTSNVSAVVNGGGGSSYPYDFNVVGSTSFSYAAIFNSYGTTGGAFFGMEGSGASGDEFSLYNFQGGPIIFYVDTSAEAYGNKFTISNTGDIALESGKKIHFEGASGDTYVYYDSGSSSLKFYVNGALAMELK